MTDKRITEALDKLFTRYRIIFWYDEDSELIDEFEGLSLSGIEKLKVENNEYQLKYKMLREKPKKKFLVYRTGKRPTDIDNWLLDIELAHEEFRTDQISIWRDEVGISIDFHDLVALHQEFFKSTKRRELLKQVLEPKDNEAIIKRRLLSICAAAKQPRIDSVLERLMDNLVLEKTDAEKLISRCNLDEFLWQEAFSYYGYKSDDANIQDFAISAFKSVFDVELKKSTELKPNITGYLNRWKNSRLHQQSFEKLSTKYAVILGIEKKVEVLDIKQLVDIDYFEVIDLKIISDLIKGLEQATLAQEYVRGIHRQRRMSHWYSKYKSIYEAIDFASQFLEAVHNMQLAPESFDDGIKRYVADWSKIDYLYRKFIFNIQQANQPSLFGNLEGKIEGLYSNNYLLTLGNNWQSQIDCCDKWAGFEALQQRDFFKRSIAPILNKGNKAYVIISDALRYEVGHELVSNINREDRFEASIDPAISELPSYTQLGMAALLPHQKLLISDDGTARVHADGMLAAGTAGRDKIIKAYTDKRGSACQSKDFMKMDRDAARDLLKDNDFLYIYHNHIDAVGDKRDTEERVFEAAEKSIKEITDVIKKLTNANASNIFVTADHGFLYQNKPLDESDYLSETPDGENVVYHDRRFVIGQNLVENKSFMKKTSSQLGRDDELDILFPKSINRLRKKGSGSRFVHGGATLQEIVIPVIKINKKRKSDVSKVEVEILQGSTNTITSGQHSVVLYQTDTATEKVQSRGLRAGIYNTEGELISDSHDLIFDSESENPRDRETRVRFVMARLADESNNKGVYLKLEEKVQGTSQYQEYKSMEFKIRRSFTSDFDL